MAFLVETTPESELSLIHIFKADLLDFGQLAGLPDAENVIFMAGRKFGSAGSAHLAHLTWASNCLLYTSRCV